MCLSQCAALLHTQFESIAEQMQRVGQTSQSTHIPSPGGAIHSYCHTAITSCFHSTAEGYHPWGKPGAGAPLVRNGHILTTVFGRCEEERQGRGGRPGGGGGREAGPTTLNPITGTAVEVCGATETCTTRICTSSGYVELRDTFSVPHTVITASHSVWALVTEWNRNVIA